MAMERMLSMAFETYKPTYTYSLSKKYLHIEKIKKKRTSKNALISNMNNQLFYFVPCESYKNKEQDLYKWDLCLGSLSW